MPAIDMGSAMKLLHSSNARAAETKEEPLAKDILLNLREIKKLEKELQKHVVSKDQKMQKKVEDSIQSIKKHLNDQGITEDTISNEIQSTQQMVLDNIELFMNNQINEMSDNTISEIVRMMNSRKDISGGEVSEQQEETIMRAMSSTLSKSGLTKSDDIKSVINYLKNIKTDVLVTSETISDMVTMNKNLNNQLIHLTRGNETNAYVIADGLSNLSESELQMLISMEELPSHTIEAIKIEDRRRKLQDYPFGQKLLALEDSFGKFNKKMEKWKTLMANPLGFIKPMFQTIGRILSLMWKTIIPTLVSLAISFFTVVLPWILLILAIVALTIIVLYLLWKHFGGYIKKLWNYVKEYVVDYFVMVWKVVKEVLSWIWDTLKFAWGVITDIYDFVDLIFSGDFIGASKIILRLMDRIVEYISGTFEHIFNIFAHFGEFLSKLPVIGPVFKFLFDILMPFMRFFIEAFKWTYSFIKDYVSVVWQNLVDMVGVVGSIFSGDFDGAMVIVDKMFERTVNFLTEHVISALIILQKLGNSLLTPIKWLWDSFKVAWDYYAESFDKVWGFIQSLPTALIGGVKDALSGIGDALNPFNWFADGGVVTGPTKAIIGEAGPEAVLPLQGSGKNTLMGVLNDFFDTYLPFFKPLVNFLWDNLKPYMPILQTVLDSIYSVVYSIISGLSKLPSWLGGDFFASMMSKMTPPKTGGSAVGKTSDDKTLLLSMLSGTISDEPVLGVVGQNKAEITKFDSSKIPMYPSTLTQLGRYIANASQSIDVPEYAKNLQEGIREIGDSIDEVADKLSSMEKNILGAVGNSGSKVVTQDKQLELAKLMSRNSYNGGKV